MFVAFCSAMRRGVLARCSPPGKRRARFRLAPSREGGVLASNAGVAAVSGGACYGGDRRMARVALIKLFTGLNLGVSQLSGELQRAGHDTRIIYFKDFLVVPA